MMLLEALSSEDDNEGLQSLDNNSNNSPSINTDTVVHSLPNCSTFTDVDQTNLNCYNAHISHNMSIEHLSEEGNEATEFTSCSSISSDSWL